MREAEAATEKALEAIEFVQRNFSKSKSVTKWRVEAKKELEIGEEFESKANPTEIDIVAADPLFSFDIVFEEKWIDRLSSREQIQEEIDFCKNFK